MRFWLFVSGVLVFAAGCAVGFVVMNRVRPVVGSDGAPLAQVCSDIPPFLVTGDEVYQKIGLDGKQIEQIDARIGEHYRRIREIRAELHDLSVDLRQGVLDVLSPEQQERFQQIQSDYAEREIQGQVTRELVNMRDELELTPEQEPRVYQILYDASREFRQIWQEQAKGADRRAARDKITALFDRRDARLVAVFRADQNAKYSERREREKRWWSERKDHRKKDGEGGPRPGGPRPADEGKDAGGSPPAGGSGAAGLLGPVPGPDLGPPPSTDLPPTAPQPAPPPGAGSDAPPEPQPAPQ